MTGIIDNFAFPEGAAEALKKIGLREKAIGDVPGITRLSGHDKGVPYRFFKHTIYNKEKSKLLKYEFYDECHMIEWNSDRYSKPVERIDQLPEELLGKNGLSGEWTGRYAEAFIRYEKGLGAAGMPLEKWDVLTDSQIATLHHNSIFTVEQFAACSRSAIASKFPKEFMECFERANQYVNGKVVREQQSKEMLALAEKNAALEKRLAELEERTIEKAVSKKKGKKGEESEDLVLGEQE
jgi:hypothetical protein